MSVKPVIAHFGVTLFLLCPYLVNTNMAEPRKYTFTRLGGNVAPEATANEGESACPAQRLQPSCCLGTNQTGPQYQVRRRDVSGMPGLLQKNFRRAALRNPFWVLLLGLTGSARRWRLRLVGGRCTHGL